MIDDHSRYGYTYLLQNKYETFEVQELKADAEKQQGKEVKILQLDRGSEYLDKEFTDFLTESGMPLQPTSLWTIL